MTLFSLLFGLSTAQAVPVQLGQQGRLLDHAGAAMTGTHAMAFRLYDSQMGGNLLWDEILSLNFINGYYTALLGDSSVNPLDDSVLNSHPLYLEIEVNGNGPIGIRQPVISSPYARLAGTAANVNGGTVDANQVSVGGQLVIDSNGSWVGPVMAVNWSDVQGIPTDIADGDDDTLAGITCNAGEILGWNGTVWTCAADNGLTEAEVEAFVTNGPIDLDAATTVGGLPILTQGDGDTLSGLACQNGDVAKYDGVLSQWVCEMDNDTDTQLSEGDVEAYVVNDAIDLAAGSMVNGNAILTDADVLLPDWNNIINIPADIADGDNDTDTVLSETEVEGYVTNAPIDLASGATVNGHTILTAADPTIASISCGQGEVLSYDSGNWTCTSFQNILDSDGDGIMSWSDCDDTDSSVLSNANDADCDGHATADDCDDNNPNSTLIAQDADCDGILSADDCSDNNANSTAIADDNDCDGVLTANDCNDNDASIYPGATEICNDNIDNDCNGTVDENCACNTSSWTIGSNWTQNNDTYRSTQLPGSSYNATNTLDSDQSSFWLSDSGVITNQWIIYDLGTPTTIEGIRFSNGQNPFSSKNITLQKSNSLSGPWTDITSITLSDADAVWQDYTGIFETSQYYRVFFHDNYGSSSYIKLRDVQFAVCN